jgi:hypothetical protein
MLLQVSMNFWNFKQLKNDLKSPHSVEPKPARCYSRGGHHVEGGNGEERGGSGHGMG